MEKFLVKRQGLNIRNDVRCESTSSDYLGLRKNAKVPSQNKSHSDVVRKYQLGDEHKTPDIGIPFCGESSIYRILPYYYIHVHDQTSNVTRVEVGPQTYIRKDNEHVIFGPEQMVIVFPGHYCIVSNPVVRSKDGSLVFDIYGQVKLRHSDIEIRLEQDPFPLYPKEILQQAVTPLTVLPRNAALHLKAVRGFDDDDVQRVAGDEWLFEGPGTYIPCKEVEVLKTIQATIIKPNQALKLRAHTEMKEREGNSRVTGEEWLVKKVGAYLPGAYEEIVEVVDAYVLTEKEAIHVRATNTFVDGFQKTRKNGEEWLVTLADTDTYIPDVYENVLGVIDATTLTNRQYCVILNPVGADGKNQFGKKKLVKGEKSFFLLPDEALESGINYVHILSENQGLVLEAQEDFVDDYGEVSIARKAGDYWMIRGPAEYIPPIEVDVHDTHYAIPLDDTEGVYVRNVKTGKVRVVCGCTYMLTENEELWEKDLPPKVKELLEGDHPLADGGMYRKKMKKACMPAGALLGESYHPPVPKISKAVTFRVPHNAAVQVYDYKEKKARVVFGPELVMLGPDEQFTVLSLSGDKPKRPAQIQTLCLLLGPDFCTDIITVETADHARLSLQLSYNWHFDIGDKSEKAGTAIFNVRDFIGDMCKAIASRIRGAVAGINFDDFHKNSAKIIRSAVFGVDEKQKVKESLRFPQNSLIITSVDIQNVEPVDERTREALQKSVQLAIEITTHSQEATAKQQAERREQEARGCLERQRILDEIEAEKTHKLLLELKMSSMVTEMCGQSKAEALSCIEAQKLKAEAAVEEAKKKTEVIQIEAAVEMDNLQKSREAEIIHMKARMEMEILKSQKLAEIETKKFKNMVSALGSETISAIATAGPELQTKLLQGLGIRSTLITDGSTPINLFTTAKGLVDVHPSSVQAQLG